MTHNWIIYLFESAVILMFFWTVYWLFLRSETFFRLNRIYLQLTLLLSLFIPLIDWFIDIKTADVVSVYILDTIVITAQEVEIGAIEIINKFTWIPIIFMVGTFVAMLIFSWGILKIISFVKVSQTVKEGRMVFVLNDKFTCPFSFLNYIFISNEVYSNEQNSHIINHEKEHVKQKHSLDLLFAGIVGVFQWFNPFAWLYKEAFREIHEYLADEAVLKQGEDPIRYKKALYKEATGIVPGVFSFFNVSFTKRRFQMMSRIKSPRSNALKVLVILPVAALLVVAFACSPDQDVEKELKLDQPATKVEGSTTISNTDNVSTEKLDDEPVFMIVEQMPEYEGGNQSMIADLVSGIVYPASAKKAGVQAKVFVEFLIDKEGQLVNAKIAQIRSVDGGTIELDESVKDDLESASIDAVRGLNKWSPGIQKGEPVKVKMVVPIAFKLN